VKNNEAVVRLAENIMHRAEKEGVFPYDEDTSKLALALIQAEKKLGKAVGVLRFYGNPQQYETGSEFVAMPIESDLGKKARQILKELEVSHED